MPWQSSFRNPSVYRSPFFFITMAQRGDCVYYVGKYALGDDGFFTGQLDNEDEDTVDIVEAMEGENQIKTKNLQDVFYFVKNTVARLVGRRRARKARADRSGSRRSRSRGG